MKEIFNLELARCSEALQAAVLKCRCDMHHRWPEVGFDTSVWNIHLLYNTRMLDVRFGPAIKDFAGMDASYLLACRCLLGWSALEDKIKNPRYALRAWRLLNQQVLPLGALRRHDLCILEENSVKTARPASAMLVSNDLKQLSAMLDRLASVGAVHPFDWGPSATTISTLKKISAQWQKQRKSERSIDVLDRQIEALSDATQAMLVRDERLSGPDRSAIAVANILMCAPSRINEPLCLKVNDRYTVTDYAKRPDGDDAGQLYQTHQLLLLKGSKGADWSAKPVLNFMVALSDICWETIVELGQRSRTILKHYEQNPTVLYLSPEIEHLRGKPVTKFTLWQIINLSNRTPEESEIASAGSGVWATFINWSKDKPEAIIKVENPRPIRSNGRKNNNSVLTALHWPAIEQFLLERVRARMQSMRRVTPENWYRGYLSEMLMLVDMDRTPYLPQAWNDKTFRARLNSPPWRMKVDFEKSVFIKLGLQMTQNGSLVDCHINTHDVRRWLTTTALDARERLSDVLINKWANRISVAQLASYDLRTETQKANQAALPVPEELQSFTEGLAALDKIETEYGLLADIAVVNGDALAVTSIDAVNRATENRPVARSGNQVIILYPNRFGVCLHQHHETPCRAYTTCSEGCTEQLTVKGHLPSNEQWRKQEELTNRSIVNQLHALVTSRQRGIADDPAMLDAHLLTLVKGVNVQTMAEDLIARFHEIKEQIRDLHFKNELEAAFVSRGIVTRLDDASIPNGAFIKYHNPTKHASPGYERAIESRLGGRKEMQKQDEVFHQMYPELAPKPLRLKDERHLMRIDGNDDENEEKDE